MQTPECECECELYHTIYDDASDLRLHTSIFLLFPIGYATATQLTMRLSPIFSHSKMYIELRLFPSIDFRPVYTSHASNRSNKVLLKLLKPISQPLRVT